MKRFTCAALAALLAAVAAAQDRGFVHSVPQVPPREALERLNLRLGWTAYVPTESQRDGLATVQLDGRLLLVQSRSGEVTALDAETGRTRWRSRFGLPYRTALPLAFNRRGVYAVNGTNLYGLDRNTGAVLWEFGLPTGVSAPPVAGDIQIYIGYGTGRVAAYILPRSDFGGDALTGEQAKYISGEEAAAGYGPGTLKKPLPGWESYVKARLEFTPVSGSKGLLIAAPEGEVVSMDKFPPGVRKAAELFRLRLTDGPILAPPGYYEDTAYIGAKDSNVYAVNADTGRVSWRFTAGTPIVRQPVATEKDVYVVADRLGLARLDRATGEPAWRLPFGGVTYPMNRGADRFLAANPKFVYASDPSGRLVVLDRATGTLLSSYPGTRDFTVPFSNGVNDRVYLAANNGLVMCLHDRDYPEPYRHTKQGELAVDPKAAEVEGKLAKPITDQGSEGQPLGAVLKALLGEKNGDFKYRIEADAFKKAGVADIEARQAAVPAVTSVPLGNVLRRVLAEVDATFRVSGDTIVIIPMPKRPAAAP
jgi:outer membrane protein assembly factor BamB